MCVVYDQESNNLKCKATSKGDNTKTIQNVIFFWYHEGSTTW